MNLKKYVILFFLFLLVDLYANETLINNQFAEDLISEVNDSSLQPALRGCIVPYLMSLQQSINTVLAHESACCSALDDGFGTLNGLAIDSLSVAQGIASSLDTCCSGVDAAVSIMDSTIDNFKTTVQADLTPVMSQLDLCCSMVDQSLRALESKVDTLPTVGIEPLISKLDACCSTIETQLTTIENQTTALASEMDTANSLIDSVPTVNLVPLSSLLDVCCSTIETELGAVGSQTNSLASAMGAVNSLIESLPTVDLTPIASMLDSYSSIIETQLSVLSAQEALQLSINQDVSSKLDVCGSIIETQLGSINDQLATNLIATQTATSKVENYASVIEAQLGSINSQLAQNLTAEQMVESKLDAYNSFIDVQLSVIESLLSTCSTTLLLTPTTLASSGIYNLCADTVGTFTVSGSDITFNLNSHTISGGLYGVTVSGNNVTVRNGTIKNALNAGILLTGTQCTIQGCSLIGSPTGMQIINGAGNTIDSCRAVNNTLAGFALLSSNTTMCNNCSVLNASGNTDMYGFYAAGGAQNMFTNCQANSIISNGGQATGYGIFGESGDKILNSKAYSIISSTTAYAQGILLGVLTNSLVTVTAAPYTASTTYTAVNALSWSPDGNYLAVGGGPVTGVIAPIRIFAFNSTLSLRATISTGNTGNTIYSITWSPDGHYLAVGVVDSSSTYGLQLYAFNGVSLTSIVNASWTGVASVQWSPDGRYLAAGVVSGTVTPQIAVYGFTGTSLVSLMATTYIGSNNFIHAINWSPDGNYIAIAPSTGNMQIWQFNGSLLTSVTGVSSVGNFSTIAWSPDGNYLAAGMSAPVSNNQLQIFAFNGSLLSTVTGLSFGTTSTYNVTSLTWSPDGHYLAVAINASTNRLFVYAFDGSILTLMNSITYPVYIGAVQWVGNGNFIAVGGSPTSTNSVTVYGGYVGCSNCNVENNSFTGIANSVGMGTSYVANTNANTFVNNYANASDNNYAMASATGNYGDTQYLQTLLASVWAWKI